MIRSGAFHALLARLWREDERRPGVGLVDPAAADLVPALVAQLRQLETPDRHRLAFALGLLLEAEPASGAGAWVTGAIRAHVRDGLPGVLAALDDVAAGRSPAVLGDALLYLVAHLDEDRERILPRISAAFGPESIQFRTVSGIYQLASRNPARGRALLMYLGAESAAAAGPDLHALAAATLACPACHGALSFEDDRVRCGSCATEYGYAGDTLDLVASGSAPPQFTEERVETYEDERHRFVRVMARDFDGHITPAREEAYLAAHLRPVDGPVLDLACGAGSRTAMVARQTGRDRVIALDYSLPMLAACARTVQAALFVRGDAGALPIASGTLGAVNCSDALQALPDPASALREVARCLRHGAPFTCLTFAALAPPYGYFQRRFPPDPRHVFDEGVLLSLFDAAGLDLVDRTRLGGALFLTGRKR